VYYEHDIRRHFEDASPLTYMLTGLPLDSGLAFVAATGKLAGTPSDGDVLRSPIYLTVEAEDGLLGRATVAILLIVNTPSLPIVTSPKAGDIPVAIVGKAWAYSAASNVYSPIGNMLYYTMTGQTTAGRGSGIGINRETGEVSGLINSVDAQAPQPLLLTVTADDLKARTLTHTHTYTHTHTHTHALMHTLGCMHT
jgi:hypothetical protein